MSSFKYAKHRRLVYKDTDFLSLLKHNVSFIERSIVAFHTEIIQEHTDVVNDGLDWVVHISESNVRLKLA